MRESSEVRLRDVISLIVGIAIVLTPFFNGDSATTHGAVRLRFIALAIVGVSLWIMFHQRQAVAEWINAGLGVALITAPIWRHGVDMQRIESAVAGAIVCGFSIACAVQIQRDRAPRPPAFTGRAERSGRSS